MTLEGVDRSLGGVDLGLGYREDGAGDPEAGAECLPPSRLAVWACGKVRLKVWQKTARGGVDFLVP